VRRGHYGGVWSDSNPTARGSAQLFGLRIPINFDASHLATGVSDFWRLAPAANPSFGMGASLSASRTFFARPRAIRRSRISKLRIESIERCQCGHELLKPSHRPSDLRWEERIVRARNARAGARRRVAGRSSRPCVQAHLKRVAAHSEGGDTAQAIPVLEQAVRLADQVRSRQVHARFRTWLGEAYLLGG
jgi:hypothetical protein